MKELGINLTDRELVVLLGLLNDAYGYPYDDYEQGVKENKEKFTELFDKVYKNNSLEYGDLPLAVLALAQAARHHIDGGDLIAIHDDVTLEEIQTLLTKLEKIKS
jgi:hypothetical protein